MDTRPRAESTPDRSGITPQSARFQPRHTLQTETGAVARACNITMTELSYEIIPDECKVYPVMDDAFSTMQDISTAGEIKQITDSDGEEYTSFEQLAAIGIVGFKLVCEHEVKLDDYTINPPDVDDGIHDGRDFDEPYATELEDRVS